MSITQPLPEIYPACVITRAQSKHYDIHLSYTFLNSEQFPDVVVAGSNSQPEAHEVIPPGPGVGNLTVTREEFTVAQQGDVMLEMSLHSC